MKALLLCMSLIAVAVSCDLRSEIAKQEMEKYVSTTPSPVSLTPTPPIDSTDVIAADVTRDGKLISVNGYDQRQTATCDEFNQLMVNGDRNIVIINGVCRQIMINGDNNNIAAEAAAELVFNGSENIIWYSYFANGKHPAVIDNKRGNVVIKGPKTDTSPHPKNSK